MGCAAALQISPHNPHYFQHNGQTLVLVGCSDREALAIWQNDKGFHWREYLGDIAPTPTTSPTASAPSWVKPSGWGSSWN